MGIFDFDSDGETDIFEQSMGDAMLLSLCDEKEDEGEDDKK